jgi:hypothetical protein
VRRPIAGLVFLTTLLGGSTAGAQDSAACAQRVTAIATTLDDNARHARVWTWTWMAAGTALLVGQGAIAAVTTGDTRVEFAVGAGASAFIPGLLLLHPPAVLADAPRLDARLDATRVDGRLGDPCLALPRARELLARDADDEALGTGWFAHTFVIGGNIVLGLLLGLGFHDWLGGAKQAVGGGIVGELQILTLSTGALQARGLGFGGTF